MKKIKYGIFRILSSMVLGAFLGMGCLFYSVGGMFDMFDMSKATFLFLIFLSYCLSTCSGAIFYYFLNSTKQEKKNEILDDNLEDLKIFLSIKYPQALSDWNQSQLLFRFLDEIEPNTKIKNKIYNDIINKTRGKTK